MSRLLATKSAACSEVSSTPVKHSLSHHSSPGSGSINVSGINESVFTILVSVLHFQLHLWFPGWQCKAVNVKGSTFNNYGGTAGINSSRQTRTCAHPSCSPPAKPKPSLPPEDTSPSSVNTTTIPWVTRGQMVESHLTSLSHISEPMDSRRDEHRRDDRHREGQGPRLDFVL